MRRISVTKIILTIVALFALAMGMSALKDALPLTKGTVIKPAEQNSSGPRQRKKKRRRARRETALRNNGLADPVAFNVDPNSNLWFAADNGVNSQQLYTYNPASGTTQQIIVNSGGSANINSIVSDPNAVYFNATRPATGQELYQWNSTGVAPLFDISPGTEGSYPYELTLSGSNLFFGANTPTSGFELYRADLPDKHLYVYDLNSNPICSQPAGFRVGPGGNLYYSAWKADIGGELGIFRPGNDSFDFFDINPGTASSNPTSIAFNSSGQIVFGGTKSATQGQELMMGDPNSPGFVNNLNVYDIYSGTSSSNPTNIQIDSSGRIVFAGTAGTATGRELAILDPNSPAPVQNLQVFDINPGAASGDPNAVLFVPGQGIYFNSKDPMYGCELYFIPQTYPWTPPSGNAPAPYGAPERVADIYAGERGSNPLNLTNLNGVLYFAATDAVNRREIWSSTTDGIGVTSPNGGETWPVGTTRSITWGTTGTVGNVKVEYSTNGGDTWTTIVSSTSNTGSYPWTVPSTPSTSCLVQVSDAAAPTEVYCVSDSLFNITTTAPPTIQLNRNKLYFGAQGGGSSPPGQSFLIQNSGGGVLNWNADPNQSWIDVSPKSGTGAGTVGVSVNPSRLAAGTYSGAIQVSDPNASNSPQSLLVGLNVYGSGLNSTPFGDFAAPTDQSTVMSSIPVTGWVLDDVGVEYVKIWGKQGDSDTLFYIGDTVFVEGARPDVEQAYPQYPNNYKAGWGYMMLTNFLPGGGNGKYTLYALAKDVEGTEVSLGSKTITCDNAHAVKPFGAIETPTQGGTASGSPFRNWGWVLTPQPNSIPTDGSTIDTYVDGVKLGHPVYNLYRSDVAAFFPGYANSNGAVGYFDFNTTGYANGVHTIYWTASDTGGNADGIGSRYFSLLLLDNIIQSVARFAKLSELAAVPNNFSGPIHFRKGFDPKARLEAQYPDSPGGIEIDIHELERLEIHLNPAVQAISLSEGKKTSRYSGYLLVGRELRPLPIGSTLNARTGLFSWLPGPGFIGDYDFVFLQGEGGRIEQQRRLRIHIDPKF